MQYVIIRHDFSEWGTHVSDDVINGRSHGANPSIES